MHRKINRMGFLMVVFIGAACVFGNLSQVTTDHKMSWLTGAQFTHIETQIDKQFTPRQFAINLWAAINYVLFKEGNDGVIVGNNDWLFSSEEFNNTALDSQHVHHKLSYIKETHQQFDALGISLVIAVIPAKARVYSQYTGKELPSNAQQRYLEFTQWLTQHNISHVDLLEPLQDTPMSFLKNDTHWSPNGAYASAQQVSAELKQQITTINWNQDKFTTVSNSPQMHQGDLANYLPLAPHFSFVHSTQDKLTSTSTTLSTPLGMFDDVNYELVVIGTSYSAKTQWNFVGALEELTGKHILNMAQQGKGPFDPMVQYLNSTEFRQQPPKLVIWEIPERYLVISPKQDNTEDSA